MAVDRGFYSKHNPYMDSPQGIGYGVTISAPHMVGCFHSFFCHIGETACIVVTTYTYICPFYISV